MLEYEKPVPTELATIIGDAIHNLRSTLDILASDVVRLNGQSNQGVYFPFAQRAADLDRQIKDKKFNRAHPDAVKLLRSFKPYPEGNKLLRALHELDIQDKHQALIPCAHAARTQPYTLMYGGHPNQIPGWDSIIPYDGWTMLMIPTINNISLGSEISASFSLAFDGDTSLAGGELVSTLSRPP